MQEQFPCGTECASYNPVLWVWKTTLHLCQEVTDSSWSAGTPENALQAWLQLWFHVDCRRQVSVHLGLCALHQCSHIPFAEVVF